MTDEACGLPSEADRAAEAEFFDGHACLTGDCPHEKFKVCFTDAYLAGVAWARANPGPDVLGLVKALEYLLYENFGEYILLEPGQDGYEEMQALSQWQAARKGKA